VARTRTSVRAYPTADRTEKVSITVAEDVLRDVRALAKQGKNNLSAYITELLAREVRLRRMKELIDDYEREHGPISEAELQKVRRDWPV
jgi:hypothetical protein